MSLAYRVDGQETQAALVLANSLGTTWELWDAQLPALADFMVVRFDHPGHGLSAEPDAPVTVETIAREVVAILDELEVERASFCGISLGGMVGMALALTAPDRVDRLVLCCTTAYLGPPESWHERAAIVRAAGTAAVAERVLDRWFGERFRLENPGTTARFRSLLEATTTEGYAACCEALAAWDARADVHAITSPTLVIAGADRRRGAARGRRVPRGDDPERDAHRTGRRRTSRQRRAARGVRRRAARTPDPCGREGGAVSDDYERGMEVRRAVLGDDHVDRAIESTTGFTADFQDLITRYAWGEIWARPGLDRRTRSCITLTALVALGRDHEIAMHVRAALRNGLTPDEIKEVLLQCAVYCGVPAANRAFAIAQQVLDEAESEPT